jgi:uncharacterized protein
VNVSIEQVLQVTNSRLLIEGTPNVSFVCRRGEMLFPEGVSIEGFASNRAGIATLSYRVSGVLVFTCERCLVRVVRPYGELFSHTMVKSLADKDLENAFLVVPDGVLNLSEVVGTDVQLLLPQVLLCREDCRGLCAVCGADLNEAECDCRQENVDS